MKKPRRVVATLLLWPWLTAFDLSRHSILPEEILGGGPPKDGIPAILEPRFVPSAEATFHRDDDRVIGVVRKGAAKAYPHGLCQIQRTIPWRSTMMSVGIAMESKPWSSTLRRPITSCALARPCAREGEPLQESRLPRAHPSA